MDNSNDHRASASTAHNRFVKVAPPTVHAGVGNALRQAYRFNDETRSLKGFEDLLGRIDDRG